MYIPDGCEGLLCGRCLRNLVDEREPPWWPNHRQRQELLVARLFGRSLPGSVCQHVASFNAKWYWP